MRKTVKVGLLLFVVGLIMLIFGIANNGIQSVYWEKGFHLLNKQERTYHPAKITSITLQTGQDVTIKRGTSASVHVTGSHKLPTVTTKNGHVTVHSNAATSHYVSGFMFTDSDQINTVQITVPKQTTINWITDTRAQTGDVRLQDVSVDHVQLTASGNDLSLASVTINKTSQLTGDSVRLTDVTAPALRAKGGDIRIAQSHFNQGNSKLTTTDGDINVTQSQFKTAQLHTDDGDIHLTQNHVDRLNADTDDGDVHLLTSKASGISARTNDGDLNVFGWRKADQGNYRYNRSAKSQYHLTSGDGDVTVTAD